MLVLLCWEWWIVKEEGGGRRGRGGDGCWGSGDWEEEGGEGKVWRGDLGWDCRLEKNGKFRNPFHLMLGFFFFLV